MTTALLLIDVQTGLDDPKYGPRNNPDAEQRMGELLAAWRGRGRPVIHVKHNSILADSPLRPERPGNALKPELAPAKGEPLFEKNQNSAFVGTPLEDYLRRNGIDSLVMVGLTTDHCVSTTARMGANLGFGVTVVSDATATHGRTGPDGRHFSAQMMHDTALASLHSEFGVVKTTAVILSEVTNL
jgi:nicotinamidase-related amidase